MWARHWKTEIVVRHNLRLSMILKVRNIVSYISFFSLRDSASLAHQLNLSHKKLAQVLPTKGYRNLSVSMAARKGPVQLSIERKIGDALFPAHLEVINESHSHSGSGDETHFRVICVSDSFTGKPLIARHRMINDLLKQEFDDGLHALTIQSKTPEQWEAEGHKVLKSPPCMGGSKHS